MRTSAQSHRAVDTQVLLLAGSSREGTVAGSSQVERCISSQPLDLEALAAMPCMADPISYTTGLWCPSCHSLVPRSPVVPASLSVRAPAGHSSPCSARSPLHRATRRALSCWPRAQQPAQELWPCHTARAGPSGHRGDAVQGAGCLVQPVPAGPLGVHGAGHPEELIRGVQGDQAVLPNKGVENAFLGLAFCKYSKE